MKPLFSYCFLLATLTLSACDAKDGGGGWSEGGEWGGGGEGGAADVDRDGFDATTDCDDEDAAVNPGATESPYDGVDNDCDAATPDDDLDGDGYGVSGPFDVDCDDDDASVSPGAPELCDGRDNNCDGDLEDEEGAASFEDSSGGWTDVSTGLAGTPAAPGLVTLSEDGVLHLCPGEWVGSLRIEAEVSVLGAGIEHTALSGGGVATVIDVAPGASASLSGLTIRGGEASVVSVREDNDYLAGGGVFCEAAALTLQEVTLVGNSASLGGALFAVGCEVTLSDTSFDRNTAVVEGGGIYLEESSANISGSSLSNHTAGESGGGIYAYLYSDLSILDTAFYNNTADDGGGVYVLGSDVSISDSSFSNNTAGRAGGGLAAFYSGNPSISATSFGSNSAEDGGGGVYIYGSDASISGSSFSNNTSGESGGGIYAYLGSPGITAADGGRSFTSKDSYLSVSDTTFEHNTAVSNGGGMFLDGGSADIRTSDFLNNNPDDTYFWGDSDFWGLNASFACSTGGCD